MGHGKFLADAISISDSYRLGDDNWHHQIVLFDDGCNPRGSV